MTLHEWMSERLPSLTGIGALWTAEIEKPGTVQNDALVAGLLAQARNYKERDGTCISAAENADASGNVSG